MGDAVRFVNENGRDGWQPVTDDGEKLWRRADNVLVVTWRHHEPYSSFHSFEPRLFRLRSIAVRKARRREHEVRATTWTEAPDE